MQAVRCSKGIQVQSNQANELVSYFTVPCIDLIIIVTQDALNYKLIKGYGILTRRRKS